SDGEGTIRDVVFDQNAAADDGGAIYSEGTFARVTVEDSSFTGNTADTGGAIYNQDASTTVVTRSTFTGNVANTRGGGIYNQNDGAFTLEHSRMEDNRAEGAGFSRDGGAVFTQNTSSFTIVRSVLANNEAQDAGGAIFVQNDSALAISDTTISGNTASGTAASDGGGAIYANNDSALLIARSTLSGNTSAGDAGGISRNNDGQLLMHNSTVSGNTAGGNGGGIIFDSFGGGAFIALESSTVAGNSAVGLGGGIYNEGDPLQEAGFERSIIASNTAAGAANDCATDGTGVFVSNGFNLDSTGTCGLGAPGDIANGNPALGPLADNGGPTETRALLTGSDAIDAAGNCTSPVIDQRGVDRPLGAACDIGAYEASPPVAVPDTTPPVLTLGGDKKQKVGRLKVEVSCDEACTATGGGKITVRKGTGKGKGKRKMKKKSFKLEDTSKDLAAGETKNLKLKPGGKKKRRKLKRAVKRAGKGKAEVTVTVTDQSGNSAKEKLSVKVKP
ncbi:MAG TPA: right-handed parallel beta-helix repeat-containing protein, partial [Polyangia bacterium]|nr:right-handed parallel beta-helix repeat-containing protein [Polyangia bacterium]